VRHAPFPACANDGCSNNAAGLPQIGYAIGKNIGNAVVRNRIRRRMRPIVASEAAALPPGVYLLGVKNDQAAWIQHEMLEQDILTTLAAVTAARSS